MVKRPGQDRPTVFIVDDDAGIRDALTRLLNYEGIPSKAYPSADLFLEHYQPGNPGCLVLDLDMPGLDGLGLQTALADRRLTIPIIFLTGKADVSKTVQAFRGGAFDFLQKPASDEQLLSLIHRAMAIESRRWTIARRFQRLTPREREVFFSLRGGMSSKEIARELDISYRTVEGHRSRVMEKMQAVSLAEMLEMSHVLFIRDESSEMVS